MEVLSAMATTEAKITVPFEQCLSSCFEILKQCCDTPSLTPSDWAKAQLIDLKLWTASLGALMAGQNSLRERLRTSPDTFRVLEVFLRSLKRSLERCLQCGVLPFLVR
jgi:hypothetical protein